MTINEDIARIATDVWVSWNESIAKISARFSACVRA
jgi:hypothetical protein